MNRTDNQYMSTADDLVFDMRMLAGSGDASKASEVMRKMLELVNEASRFDREMGTDESNLTISYVISQSERCADNIAGIPVGNKSRTAKEAHLHRMSRIALEAI